MTAQAVERTETQVSVPTAYLKEALTACLLSVAKPSDGRPPILEAVRLSVSDGELVVTSTDSFRLTRATLKAEGEQGFTFLLAGADAKRLASALTAPKSNQGAYPAWLSVQGETLSVVTLEGSSTFRTVLGDYPSVEKIWDAPTDPKPAGHVGFAPRFMADLCKMPRTKGDPLVLDFNTPDKNIRAEWSTDGVAYLHLLMPIRVDRGGVTHS